MGGSGNAETQQAYVHFTSLYLYSNMGIACGIRGKSGVVCGLKILCRILISLYLVQNDLKASCGFIIHNKKHLHMNIKL